MLHLEIQHVVVVIEIFKDSSESNYLLDQVSGFSLQFSRKLEFR